MSHFYVCCNSSKENLYKIKGAYKDIYYSQETVKEYRSGNVFAAIYGEAKVIPDVVDCDESSGSWLVAVGMPLLEDDSGDSDSTILSRFLKDPKKFLRKSIDGQFALFVYDGKSKCLYAATDFNRFIPIYYTQIGDEFVLCSSEIALAKVFTPALDLLGFTQAVQLGVTWESRTRFEGLYKINPCELFKLSIDEKRYEIEKYWRPEDENVWQGGFDYSLNRWSALLENSVRKFYKCAGVSSVSSDFTAGEDARLIVAQCHALGIPFKTRVSGFPDSRDVVLGVKGAEQAGFEIRVDPYVLLSEEDVAENALRICFDTDGYKSFFSSALRYGTLMNRAPSEYESLHFAGVPGGEVYRGRYYLRGKVIFPNAKGSIDCKFFTRLKFLLDYYPNLTRLPDREFVNITTGFIEESISGLGKFSKGIKIDHILRNFQNCNWGASVRQPFYLPLGTRDMTKSIYSLPPKYKRSGLITRACTESLYPKLAYVYTQENVPTIRRSLRRVHYFLPGYLFTAKKIINGFKRRVAHIDQRGNNIAARHSPDIHSAEINAILTKKPYSDWFCKPSAFATTDYYNQEHLKIMLDQAKSGNLRYVSLFGRMVNQELVYRYVYGLS